MRKYYEEITFIRAIACLLVVLTHVTLMYPLDMMDTSTNFDLIVNQLARVGTPMFCMISAFLLFNSSKDKKISYRRFIKSRIKKIVIPYIIWSIIYLIITRFNGEVGFKAHNIFGYIFLGDSYVHLYFISVVLQFYIFFLLTNRIYNKRNILFITLLSIVVMAVWYDVRTTDPIFNHRAFLLNWIGFFMMGGYLAYFYEEIKTLIKRHYKWVVYYGVMGILCIMIEINLPHLFTSDRLMNIYLVPTMLVILIAVYPRVARSIKRVCEFIGNRAMGVYLIHMLVIGSLGEVMSPKIWNPDFLLGNYLLVVLITLLTVEILYRLPFSDYLFPVAQNKSRTIHKSTN